MKLPALWIAASFAAGIAVGDAVAEPGEVAGSQLLPPQCCSAEFCCGARKRTRRWALALLAWAALGGLAIGVERTAVPANHVTRLISAGRLDTTEPLRWQGRLREDPMALPWGRRYEIDLEQVEIGDAQHAGQRRPAPESLRRWTLRRRAPRLAGGRSRGSSRARAAAAQFPRPGRIRRARLSRAAENRPHRLAAQRRIAAAGRPPAPDLCSTPRAHPWHSACAPRRAFPGAPQRAAVLRAMLLGDRSFVDSEVVTAFQKTAAYHVLVVAGLHVGALVVFLPLGVPQAALHRLCHELAHDRSRSRPTWASCRIARRFFAPR